MRHREQNLAANGANQSSKDDNSSPTFKNILHVAGFPNLIEPREHIPSDAYCRILSMAGNGFPFWPGSTPILPEPYTRRTIEVGDVGFINQKGNFKFAFNLFLPSDDPLNQLSQKELPQGYVPLDPPFESEISRIPKYYSPGSVIVTKGVDVHRLGEYPLHLKFTSSEPEAAVLVLPDGARREDLATFRVQEYLKKHAENWIQYFSVANPSRAIPNGGIYVITGFDKAVSYSASTFPGRGFVGNRRISFEYASKFLQLDRRTGIVSYNWKTGKGDTEERCLFLRGIRIGLSDPEWNLRIDEVHPDCTPVSVLPPTPPISDQVLPAKQDGRQSVLPESDSHSEELGVNSDDDENQAPVVDTTFKVRNCSFHPSDLILQIMLSEYPDAKVALVDDYTWSLCLEIDKPIQHSQNSKDPLTFKCLQGGFVSDWGALLDNIFKSHRIVETDGILFLTPKPKKTIAWIWWLRNIRNRLRPKRLTVESAWASNLILDLIRQGEAIKESHEIFEICY